MNKSISYFEMAIFLFILSFMKYSFGIGSFYCTFSAVSLAPLLGYMFGAFEIGSIYTLYALLASWVTGSFFLPFLTTLGLPTIISSLCFSEAHHCFQNARFNRWADHVLYIGIPLLAVILFIVHPEGSRAMSYSLYWIIPIMLYATGLTSHTIFGKTISSTFIAHAIGSICFLYFRTISAQQWLSLIPVVAIERLIIATSMTLIVYSISAYSRNNKTITLKKERIA